MGLSECWRPSLACAGLHAPARPRGVGAVPAAKPRTERHAGAGSRDAKHGASSRLPRNLECAASKQEEDQHSPDRNWDFFWKRYQAEPGQEAGWAGTFASYAEAGSSPEDVRFKDRWVRLFKEHDADGKFRMKVIRVADQNAQSWPRAGRERPDGNDEIVLEGSRGTSSFPEGFWHPYGRGSPMPDSRVVCLNADAIGQVTIKLPNTEELAAAQKFDFMGGSESTLVCDGARHILAVTYKGEGGGAILFHQQSWDPAFLPGIDPRGPLDIPALIGTLAPGPPPSEDPGRWGLAAGKSRGVAQTLRFDRTGRYWRREPDSDVAWAPPEAVRGNRVLYRYAAGAYGLYPRNLSAKGEAPLAFEHGVALGPGRLRRYIARYGEDRWVASISVEDYGME